MQAIDRTAPTLPTTPARMSHDYVRHGTTHLKGVRDGQKGRENQSPLSRGGRRGGGGKGWDSFRWKDEKYSEVYFDYCQSNAGAPNKSIEVELRRDNTAWPDNSWGTKTFSKCFSSYGSRGEWTGIGYGDTFFQIGDIDGGAAHGFYVYGASYVDTTQAD